MSRQADEVQYSDKNKRSNNTRSARSMRFVSFHPTVAEREAVIASEMDFERLALVVGGLLQRGLTLKLTVNSAGTAYCAVVAEVGQVFGEGTALSCFHADLYRLFQQVDYMLNVKWTGYPEKAPTGSQGEFDW